MKIQSLVVASVAVFSAIACAPRDDTVDSDGTWVGTITTEGNVTTVVNESGSVWSGTATLVEELSIGVDRGAPHYMLGPPRTLWDSGDRIIIPDVGVPTVRVFDGAGEFLGEVGRGGQGPGEYRYPWSAIELPDGRIAVSNSQSEWVDVFTSEFEYLDRWEPVWSGTKPIGIRPQGRLILGDDGVLHFTYFVCPGVGSQCLPAWKPVGLNETGPAVWSPKVEREHLYNCLNPECTRRAFVAFEPPLLYEITSSGDVVSGVADEYRFEILHTNGATTVVHRFWEPEPLSDAEWEYWMRRQRAYGLSRNPAWRPSWSADVPRHKPAFDRLYVSRDGRILMTRQGPSRRVEPCTEDPQPGDSEFIPCWESETIWDYFDAEGRYLGEIEQPPRIRPSSFPFIDGERFTIAVEDDAGTIMVKRYRLVLPGGEGH